MQKLGFVRRQNIHHFFDSNGAVNRGIDFDAIMKVGKWTWNHAPASYVELNYDRALEHLEDGTPFGNTNIPPGYKFEPWTIKAEMEKKRQASCRSWEAIGREW